MANARLRKAFHYPDDSDYERLHEELDEEEQEQVIKHLQKQNEQANANYSTIFTVIPLLSAMVFVPSIVHLSSTPYERLLSLISVVSLAATASAMKWFMPLHLSTENKGRELEAGPIGPAERIPTVNLVVCVLLVLVYVLTDLAESLVNIRPGLYLIPPAMFLTILATQKVMSSVDPSLLEGLRYEYKGA